MNKKVYVCEEEERGESGYTLVKVCEDLERAREWIRDSFIAFKKKNAGAEYLSDNKEFRWFEGVSEGKRKWECYHMNEHIGWYVTEVEMEMKERAE